MTVIWLRGTTYRVSSSRMTSFAKPGDPPGADR